MFSFSSPQSIHFGRGQSQRAAPLAAGFGETALLVHGATAARAAWLTRACTKAGLNVRTVGCSQEPSLPDIETALGHLDGFRPAVVIALGGGSVMDFAKALAALLPCTGPPLRYLEGVGDARPLEAPPLPVIALPTTAGTGAEVTKNAVLYVPSHQIKVSLRDPRMIPQIAIVDADLMRGAPKRVTLAAGLDAVAQVIEPYLCLKANPMTDALTRGAIPMGLAALRGVVENDDVQAWDDLAWVSTTSGLALANAGLGAVHGLAGVIGGKTQAPHGEICGALLPAVLASHQRKAESGTEVHQRIQWVLAQLDTQFGAGNPGTGLAGLRNWSTRMGLRPLSDMGLARADHAEIADAAANSSSMRATPFALTQTELTEIMVAAG